MKATESTSQRDAYLLSYASRAGSCSAFWRALSLERARIPMFSSPRVLPAAYHRLRGYQYLRRQVEMASRTATLTTAASRWARASAGTR